MRAVCEREDGTILVAHTGGVSVIDGDTFIASYGEEDGITNTESLTVAVGTDGDIVLSFRALNREPDAAPEQILKNVRAGVDGFVREAEQFDDLTMLCFKYIGIKEALNESTGEQVQEDEAK